MFTSERERERDCGDCIEGSVSLVDKALHTSSVAREQNPSLQMKRGRRFCYD